VVFYAPLSWDDMGSACAHTWKCSAACREVNARSWGGQVNTIPAKNHTSEGRQEVRFFCFLGYGPLPGGIGRLRPGQPGHLAAHVTRLYEYRLRIARIGDYSCGVVVGNRMEDGLVDERGKRRLCTRARSALPASVNEVGLFAPPTPSQPCP